MRRPSQCRNRVSPRCLRGRTYEPQPARWCAMMRSSLLAGLRSTTRRAWPRGPVVPDDSELRSSSASFLGDPRWALGRSTFGLERWSVGPGAGGEFLDRSAAKLAWLAYGFPKRNQGGDRVGIGDTEEVTDLPLLGDRHRGESAAIP